MKKRFILTLIFSLALAGLQTEPAQAGFVGSYKARISANREIKNTQQEIKEVFVKQDNLQTLMTLINYLICTLKAL